MEFSNWSKTKTVQVKQYFEPKSKDELKEIIRNGKKIRICGSNMSPSGIGLGSGILVSMKNFEKIIAVDPEKK